MIPGGGARPARCERPEVHRQHQWVPHPASQLEYACDGQPRERDEIIVGLVVSAA